MAKSRMPPAPGRSRLPAPALLIPLIGAGGGLYIGSKRIWALGCRSLAWPWRS